MTATVMGGPYDGLELTFRGAWLIITRPTQPDTRFLHHAHRHPSGRITYDYTPDR